MEMSSHLISTFGKSSESFQLFRRCAGSRKVVLRSHPKKTTKVVTLVIGPTPLDPLSPSRDICVKFLNLPYMANFYDLLQGVPKKRVISEKWSLWATGLS